MSRSAHTEAQIIAAVKQVESGRKVEEVAREALDSRKSQFRLVRKRVAGQDLEILSYDWLKQSRQVKGEVNRLGPSLTVGARLPKSA
jgi:hypothetical protein